MSKVASCHYCSNRATKNLVWLEDARGNPRKTVLPYCGCDLMQALRRLWPNPPDVCEGTDYIIEPLPEDMHHNVLSGGNGETVRFKLRLDTGAWVETSLPRLAARKFGRDIEEASHRPMPGCTDGFDHFHGHCGCK